MKSFSQFILEETSYRRKGYINIKTGKMVLFPFAGRGIRPFHTEYVLKNANKFIRGGENALLRKFADANGFEPEDEETISMWVDIKTGKVDRDPNLDSIMEAEGWRRVVFDEGISSVEPRDRREGQRLVKMILDKIPWKNIESLNVFDQGHLNDMTTLYSEEDAYSYIKRGSVPRRSKIGSTMAMFRGESVSEQIVKGELIKGWMTPRGKLMVYPRNSKQEYHLQILTQLIPYEKMRPHMGEFIGSEHLKFIEKMQKDGTSDFTDEQMKELVEREYKRVYKMWATGRVDSDRTVEGKFVDMGWVKIVIDRNQYGMSAIEGSDRQTLKCAKKLDKMFGGWEGFATKSMMISSKTSVSRIGSAIRDSAGWDHYLKTGQVKRQTEIGRKMSQFREFVQV